MIAFIAIALSLVLGLAVHHATYTGPTYGGDL